MWQAYPSRIHSSGPYAGGIRPFPDGGIASRGYATLVISLVLLFVISIATFTTARTGLFEQKISNNEYRRAEIVNAAEAALEYSAAWLAENTPAWSGSTTQTAAPTSTLPTITTASGDTLNLSAAFSRDTTNPQYIRIDATARAASDETITAMATRYVRVIPAPVSPAAVNAPPLLMDGCLSDATGNPDIFPGPSNMAAATSQPDDGNGSDNDGVNDCITWGQINPHGGASQGNAFTGDVWDQLFAVSRTEMKAIADAEVAAGVANAERTVVWVSDSGNYHTSWGSPTHPVVVVFDPDADCPKINGGPTIYGIVFMDSACSGANGWGGTSVYGSVVVNGDVSKLTANTAIYDWSLSGSSDSIDSYFDSTASLLPGTWKDF